jgi:membrane-associated protease RseP (regulator of RpoE activity)
MSGKQPKKRNAFQSRVKATGLILIIGIALWAFWAGRSRFESRPSSANFGNAMQSLITNSTEFARSRITGGVGVVLSLDTATGLPRVMSVKAGSPADKAGLRAGDVITRINGATTTGQKLAEVVMAIRGFSLGSVAITVLRGQTNATILEFDIRRNSMNSLLQLTNHIP